MGESILKDVQPPLTQDETAYVAVSPQTGTQQCANCRFFLATNWSMEGNNMLGPACVLVSGYPEPILATGWCNEWEKREPYKPEPMEVEIVDETTETPTEEAEVVVTETKAVKVYAAPKDLNAAQKIMRKAANSLQPGTTILRSADGDRHMLIVTSNGFKDRHEEHVATMALKEYVEGFAAGTVKKNKHMFWHAVEVGEIVAAGMVNGFLVEIAKEKGVNGKKFYDYVEAHPDGWGASQGFWVRAKDIRMDGDTQVYKRIDKDETTSLPRDAAANLFTLSAIGEGMAKSFEKLADEIFGEGTAAALTKGTGELKKKLLADGAVQKKKDAATVEDAANAVDEAQTEMPTTAAAKDKLTLRLIDGMEALLTEVKGVLAATEVAEEKADAVDEEVKSLKKALDDQQKAHAADLAEIREKMSMKPRIASADTSTRKDGDEAVELLKKIAPKETKRIGGIEYASE